MRCADLPGVQAVAATDDPQLAGGSQGGNVTVAGYTPPTNEEFDIEESIVNPDYFHAMQVPMVVGRTFNQADDATGQPVAIVNETFVRHYFKSAAAAIGGRVANGGGDTRSALHDHRWCGARHAAYRPARCGPADTLYAAWTGRCAGAAPTLPADGHAAGADVRDRARGDAVDRCRTDGGRPANDG